ASTQSGTRFEEAIEITAPQDLAGRIGMKEARFTPRLDDTDAVSGELILVDDGADTLADGRSGSIRDACEPLPDDDAFADAIALIERGGCDFQDKLQRVEAAGAIGAIVYN